MGRQGMIKWVVFTGFTLVVVAALWSLFDRTSSMPPAKWIKEEFEPLEKRVERLEKEGRQ